jgi:hypothetical protein
LVKEGELAAGEFAYYIVFEDTQEKMILSLYNELNLAIEKMMELTELSRQFKKDLAAAHNGYAENKLANLQPQHDSAEIVSETSAFLANDSLSTLKHDTTCDASPLKQHLQQEPKHSQQYSQESQYSQQSVPNDKNILGYSSIHKIIKLLGKKFDGIMKNAKQLMVEILTAKVGNTSENVGKFKTRAANFLRSPNVFMVNANINTNDYAEIKKRVVQDAMEHLVHKNLEYLKLKLTKKPAEEPMDNDFTQLCWSSRDEFFKVFIKGTRGEPRNVMAVLKNVLRHIAELPSELKTEYLKLYVDKTKKKETEFKTLVKYFYIPDIPLEEVIETEYAAVAKTFRQPDRNISDSDFADNYSSCDEVGCGMNITSNLNDEAYDSIHDGSNSDKDKYEDSIKDQPLVHIDGTDKQSTGNAQATVLNILKQFDAKAEVIKCLQIYKRCDRDTGNTILSQQTVDNIGTKLFNIAKKRKSHKIKILIVGCKEPLNIIMLMKKVETLSVKFNLTVIERNSEQISNLKNTLTEFGLSAQTENVDFLFFDSVKVIFDVVITLISGSMSALVALKLCSLKVQHETRIIAPQMIMSSLEENYKELNVTSTKQQIDVYFATLCSRNITESQGSIKEKEESCWIKRKDSDGTSDSEQSSYSYSDDTSNSDSDDASSSNSKTGTNDTEDNIGDIIDLYDVFAKQKVSELRSLFNFIFSCFSA